MSGQAIRTVAEITPNAEALSELIDCFRDGVVVLDRRGTVLLANEAAQQVLRPLGAGLVGTTFDQHDTVADRAEVEITATGAVVEMRVRTHTWEGRHVRVVNLRDVTERRRAAETIERGAASLGEAGGGTTDRPATGQDVAEARQIQRQRDETRRLLEAIADNTPVAINIKDRQGYCVFANRRHLEVIGRSREELLTITDRDFLPRELADELALDDARVLAEGVVITREDTLELPRGTLTTWLTVKFPIRDEQDRPYLVGLVALDITEQRRVVEALRDSEERFRLLAEWSKDAIYLVRLKPSPVVEYVSPAVAAILGRTPQELTGDIDTVLSMLSPGTRDVAEAALRSPTVRPQVFRNVRPDGSVNWVERQSVPIHDADGNVVALEGTLRDVTERVVAEQERAGADRRLEQAERLESLGQLAGGIAHDFNNLLAVIVGTAQLLAEDLGADPRGDDVQRIISAAERGANLTRQLLIFSRREPGRPQITDLNDIVTGIEDMVKRVIGEDIRFACHLDTELPPVNIDRSQMEQVIVNLVVNARHAMPQGGELSVETSHVIIDQPGTDDVPAGSYVLLTVSDTGMGMSPQVAKHAFEPFFTTRKHGEGTGLGLATVHGIVTQAAGHITVDSHLGRGTRFDIYLPSASGIATHAAGTTGVTGPQGRGETILLVEDEQPVRDVINRILTRNNYRVLVAGDPQEAIDICAQPDITIHAMLSDIIMPGMSGSSLCEQLHATTRPGLPVLYMSGYPGRRFGAEEHIHEHAGGLILTKPFDADTLLHRLRQLLET